MTALTGFWPDGRGYNSRVAVTLSSRDRARLKARAHALEPVVRIGHAGITSELVAEVDRALSAHELIKVSIAAADREERVTLGGALAERVDAAPVHRVGKILILWRAEAGYSPVARPDRIVTKLPRDCAFLEQKRRHFAGTVAAPSRHCHAVPSAGHRGDPERG